MHVLWICCKSLILHVVVDGGRKTSYMLSTLRIRFICGVFCGTAIVSDVWKTGGRYAAEGSAFRSSKPVCYLA